MSAYLGEFEHLLLLAVLRLGTEAYAPDLARELDLRAARAVSRGALYTSLDRLEDKGLVRWKVASGTELRDGLPRRVYTVTSAGLAAAPTDNTYAPRPVIPDLPVYIAKALKANSKAWEFFRELAPTYRRNFVVWIHTAKRAETRERRIRESIALLAAGKKLGLK